jgi:regulator of sigma E protease
MELLQTLLAFFFVLGAVVVLHEMGHFLVAKAVGVYCKTFSVGFGPRLFRRQWGETEYQIAAVPFGGFVKMAGEGAMEEIQDAGTSGTGLDLTPDGEPIPPERYFSNKTPWQRLAVIVAGPLMNLVLAFVVLFGLYLVGGVEDVPITGVGTVVEDSPAERAGIEVGDRLVEIDGVVTDYWYAGLKTILDAYERDDAPVTLTLDRQGEMVRVQFEPERVDGRWSLGMHYRADTRVGKVKRGGPAWNAGLRRGAVITSIDGLPVTNYSQVAEKVNASIDTPLQLTWTHEGEVHSATVTPEAATVAISFNETETLGRIYYEEYREARSLGVGESLEMGARTTWGMVGQTALFLKTLIAGGASKDAVSGPLRIAQFSGEMVRWGFDYLLRFLALFSVNLFLLNLLPVPVLDGGHAVFILYELILRRPANQRVQAMATQVGFVALMLLMAWVLTMDVINVVS